LKKLSIEPFRCLHQKYTNNTTDILWTLPASGNIHWSKVSLLLLLTVRLFNDDDGIV
jgi:hypothetical protein